MWITAYMFLLPAILLWIVWFFLPFIRSFVLSFYQYNYVMPIDNHLVGLQNYTKLFKDKDFYSALIHSLEIVIFAVPIQTIISFFMALMINTKFRGKGIFRTVFYIPYVISSIAVATVFMYLFSQHNVLPMFFHTVFHTYDVGWFTEVRYALALIIVMYVWQQVGFYMIIYLSGLQTISTEVLEAAEIDGANSVQKLRYITVPLLKPVTFLVVTYGVITSFQIFDQISAVAGTGVLGSPGGSITTLVTFFYMNAFKFGEVGYGSAAAVVLFLLIFSVTILQKKIMEKE